MSTISLPGQPGRNKIGIVVNASGGLMSIYVNGNWSADVPYSGTLANFTEAVELAVGNSGCVEFSEIRTKLGVTMGQGKAFIEDAAA